MDKNNSQKVKITILETFETKLLHKYLEQDGGGLNLNDQNKALLQIVIGRHGQEVIAYLTEDGGIAVNGEPYGVDGYVMVGFEFINLENIKPLGTCYFTGKMYRLVDQDNQLGIFVKMDFNVNKKEMEYTIMTTSMERVTGTTMAEMNDDDLNSFGFDRKSYYAEA